MNMQRWLLPLILTLSLLVTGSSCAREESEGLQAKSTAASSQQQDQRQVKWLGFNDGLAKARSEDKPIFLEFYTDWCPYCRKFQKETVNDRKVSRMLAENFVYVRFNAEDTKNRVKFDGKSYTHVELTQAFGIRSYPSLVFLDSTSKPITMLSGFVPPNQFATVLDYIQQKCYETQVSFNDFTKRGNCN
ncbi:MAG: thioredoxin family protein [Deltaproteobacteria bacterium]|nr:thioredoxin family protein [Deltaproteobacteria bacterium]